MQKSRLVDWLQIIANISLVIGLLLVGLQLRQSSELTRVQLFNSNWSDSMSMRRTSMGENPAQVLAKTWTLNAEYSDEDLYIFEEYMAHQLEYWLRIKALGGMGLAGKDEWRTGFDRNHPEFSGELYWLFATPLSRAWWINSGRWYGDEEFTNAVNQVIEEPLTGAGVESAKSLREELNRQVALTKNAEGPSMQEVTEPDWHKPGR